MKLTRVQLRRLILEVATGEGNLPAIEYDDPRHPDYSGNPGSQFKSAVDQAETDKMITNLTKARDWFEGYVFPAIKNDEWPISTDEGYELNSITIPGGQSFHTIDDKIRIYWGGGAGSYHEYTLEDLWDMFEEDVVDSPAKVSSAVELTSVAGFPE